METAGRDRSRAVGDAGSGSTRRLVGLAESPRLSRMHRTLLTETRMCLPGAGRGPTPAPPDGVAEHREIAEAFRDGNARLTDRLLVAHMNDAVQRLIRRGHGGLACQLHGDADVLGLQELVDADPPPSRPSPDCLTPPNGAAGLDTTPWLSPTMPVSMASPTRSARRRSLVYT